MSRNPGVLSIIVLYRIEHFLQKALSEENLLPPDAFLRPGMLTLNLFVFESQHNAFAILAVMLDVAVSVVQFRSSTESEQVLVRIASDSSGAKDMLWPQEYGQVNNTREVHTHLTACHIPFPNRSREAGILSNTRGLTHLQDS